MLNIFHTIKEIPKLIFKANLRSEHFKKDLHRLCIKGQDIP